MKLLIPKKILYKEIKNKSIMFEWMCGLILSYNANYICLFFFSFLIRWFFYSSKPLGTLYLNLINFEYITENNSLICIFEHMKFLCLISNISLVYVYKFYLYI